MRIAILADYEPAPSALDFRGDNRSFVAETVRLGLLRDACLAARIAAYDRQLTAGEVSRRNTWDHCGHNDLPVGDL